MPSRHAAARQQFMLPCTCNHASDMYPVCQQRRVTAQETCSPNACPEVSKAVQPIRGCLHRFCRRTDAAPKVLVAKRVCLCLCVSVSVCDEACGVPYGRSVFCLRAGGGGWWVHPRILSLLHPSFSPACRVHPPCLLSCLSWYVHKVSSLSSSSAGSRHLGLPQDEPSFRACRPCNAPSSCSGREHALLPSNSSCRRRRTHQSRF